VGGGGDRRVHQLRAPNTFELTHDWRPAPAVALTALFSTALLVMYVGHQSPFLYFQF
jgi:hypothetical protein